MATDYFITSCSRSGGRMIAGAIALCILLLSGCSRSGISEETQPFAVIRGEVHKDVSSFRLPGPDDINPAALTSSEPGPTRNVIIPGRAMRSRMFMPGSADSIILGSASLKVPHDALEAGTVLSVTGLLTEDLPPVPDEITNVTKGYWAGYRFLPHGTSFRSSVAVAMGFDETLLPEGYSPDDIYTFYFDDNACRWRALQRDSVDSGTGTVYSGSLHFTDMINGIITVPESPQTDGFVPTILKDLQAAYPAEGITLIDAPRAGSEGDADLSFPLKLPEGRSGMKPSVSLLYSSAAASGWAGYGWSLTVPGISVDPSWGVPRYLPDKESETYLFEGSQLTPVAHRTDYSDRSAEKRFYPRIESSFSRIIRHGNAPVNYWWEVTTREGVRNFYGGSPGTGVVADAVSRDASGNIGYWALVETRDLHENFISYSYVKPPGCGEQLYVSEIAYTGHGTGPGPYRILFSREEESDSYQRQDATVNARSGYIVRDRELLRRVNILYDNEPVRSYALEYREGVFRKTLLESITELDAAGAVFYSHRFSYYDDIHADNGIVPYAPEKSWSLPDDDLSSPYLNLFLDDISVIGGSGSLGGSGKVTSTVGLLDGKPWLKSMTAGGSVSYQGSTNEGFLALIDINNDGLPDKVFKKDGNIYYRRNLLAYPGEQMFGEKRLLSGISNINISKTTGFGWSAEANPPFTFVGYENTNTKTKITTYFDDFNADGLVDLVDNGIVYFNHIDSGGDPVFSASSELTPNPLYANSAIDMSMLPDPAAEQAALEEQFPLHDAVRMWRAPYTGTVNINAPVYLLPDPAADTLADGVKAVIQHNGNILWSAGIEPGDDTARIIPPLSKRSVMKGDHIYFRLQSVFNGAGDMVYWDPLITYESISAADTLPWLRDSNNKRIGRFRASEDFILTGIQSVGMPKTGRIKLSGTLSKPELSDTIKLEIYRTDSLGARSILITRVYEPSPAVINDPVSIEEEVVINDFISIRIITNTAVDWSSVRLNTLIEYTRIDDGTPVTGSDGKPLLSFNAVPEFAAMFNNPVRHELPMVADSSFMLSLGIDSVDQMPHMMKVVPDIVFGSAGTDTIVLSVKSGNRTRGEKTYHFSGDLLTSNDTLFTEVRLGDSLWFEYHLANYGLAESTMSAEVKIGKDSVKASLFSTINPADMIFGHLYRGWGQFDYNGNAERTDMPIDESLLRLPDLTNQDVTSIQDTSDLGGVKNPLDEVFNMMIPHARKSAWQGTDEQVFILAEYMSSSRLGEKNVKVEPIRLSATGLNAIAKVNSNSVKSVAGGLSTLSYSHSWGKNNMIIDMTDMNGDRYPDLLSTNNIQYTGVSGVLAGTSIAHSLGDHYSESEAEGFTLGGNYVFAKSNNTGTGHTSQTAKSKTGDNAKNGKNAQTAGETSRSSIGISGSFSTNDDNTLQAWLDINGDRLPDKIYSNGTVRLNLGYSFAPPEPWNFDAICSGESEDFGGGLGINISNGSFTAGVSLSLTENKSNETFIDINSDGLPDMVKGTNVWFNTGSSFAPPVEWPGIGTLDAGESVGQSANTGFTIGIGIPILFIKICINPSGSVTSGISHTLTQIVDIDGDGMPDFISSDKEGELKVRSSRIFRTNILKTVANPLGGSFSIDYLLTPCTYRHPGGKLAMASVKILDGLAGDGADTTFTSFEYTDGYYDRHERLFYGFASVTTRFHDTQNRNSLYRISEQSFSNSDYYTKGMMLSETLTDSGGRKWTGSENTYSLRNIHSGELLPGNYAQSNREPAFVALEETLQHFYSGSPQPGITTRVTYSYDTLGNISGYTDYSSGNGEDRYAVAVQYHHNDTRYIHSIPSLHEVTTAEGTRRKSATAINDLGEITRISRFVSGDNQVNYDMEYDLYGNLAKITRPANHRGESLWYEYEYDPAVNTYVTSVTDAYGYSSTASYDYRWGTAIERTDMNSRRMTWSYDDMGRLVSVTGPDELASGKPYTAAFEYYPGADVPYAHTLHYDSINNSDIETWSFADGLGRLVQLKKSALLFTGQGAEDTPGFIVSGMAEYDPFGRITGTYQPVFESGRDPAAYNKDHDNIAPVSTTYDVRDRVLTTTLADGSVTSHNYSIGDFNGRMMQIDSLEDALGRIFVTVIRPNGRKAASVRVSAQGNAVTEFRYNPLGELREVTDPHGNKTISEYDMTGRMLSVNQPDGGLTEFIYDGAGNIIEKVTANIRELIPDGGAIRYNYDHERLSEIVYPKNYQNRVNYIYGAPGESFNRAGRIAVVKDASGGQEFFYNKLGQVIKTIRTMQLGESDMRTWIWSSAYDSWDRIMSMTYPDGEKVTYSYDRAGNLQAMTGEKLGRSYTYISRIGYDKFERQVWLKYGNGTESTRSFEPERQRLSRITISSGSRKIVDNTYTWDRLSNILGIAGNPDQSSDIGGTASHTYSYDDLNQLTNASGSFTGRNGSASYTLTMRHDIMGRILQKTQALETGGDQQGLSYDLIYGYEGLQPNAATSAGSRVFSWDHSGNLAGWQDTITSDYRQLAWDEENRLTLISDNGYVSRYVYDAEGTRVIKSHGGTQGVYVNGAPAGLVNHSSDNYTVYVSPWFVFRKDGFTKHYYNGSTRVSSKVGNGQFKNQYRPGVFELTAGKENYIKRQQYLLEARQEYESGLGLPPGPPTMKGIYADPEFSGTAYPDAGTSGQDPPRGWPKQPVFAPAGGPPGAPVQWSGDVTNENVTAGFGFAGTGSFEEMLRYFYHTDHIGSVSCITDARGETAQYIAYLPFGEVFAEQHAGWDSPYKFNAKELDTETGLYYFGARYYDPKTSLWISPDPVASEYPGWSPYNFCLGNPVYYVDLTGNDPGDFFLSMDEAARDWGVFYNAESISRNIEYGSTIYRTSNPAGASGYTYTPANRGEGASVSTSAAPEGAETVADIHSHGSYSFGEYDDDVFSGIMGTPEQNKLSTEGDLGGNNAERIFGYVATPSGSLQKYDPGTGIVSTLADDLPGDINDPMSRAIPAPVAAAAAPPVPPALSESPKEKRSVFSSLKAFFRWDSKK